MLCPISNQSPQEELFNQLSHGAGLVLSLVGLGGLLAIGWQSGPAALLVALVYGLSVVQLFAVSTFYHAS